MSYLSTTMLSPVTGPSRPPNGPRPTKQPRRTEAHDVAGSTLTGMQPRVSLEALPDDVLLSVVGLVDVKDVIALRLVSSVGIRWGATAKRSMLYSLQNDLGQ